MGIIIDTQGKIVEIKHKRLRRLQYITETENSRKHVVTQEKILSKDGSLATIAFGFKEGIKQLMKNHKSIHKVN